MTTQPVDGTAPNLSPAAGGVFTEEHIRHLPATGNRYEIIDGSLIVTPPADGRHQDASGAVAVLLRAALRGYGWLARIGGGVRAAADLVPDVMLLRPNAPRDDELFIDPEHVALVVEIASATTVERDRITKLDRYAHVGIPMYWQVDRRRGLVDLTVHVHSRPEEGAYTELTTVRPGETLELTDPFKFTLSPAQIIAEAD